MNGMKIYISSRVSGKHISEIEENVRRAIEIGMDVWDLGHYSYIPHLTRYAFPLFHTLDPTFNLSFNNWIRWNRPWLIHSDAILVLDNSPECSIEERMARYFNKKIFKRLEEIPPVDRKIPLENFVEEYYNLESLPKRNDSLGYPTIYISGPYTPKNNFCLESESNTFRAMIWGFAIWREKGLNPYIPHLSHYIRRDDLKWEDWMLYARPWLNECDYFFIYDESRGALMEKRLAKKLGKRIFEKFEDIPSTGRPY